MVGQVWHGREHHDPDRLVDDTVFAQTAAQQPNLAVLLVSAKEAEACPERVRECGARAFVLKPKLPPSDLAQLWGM